MKRITYLWLAAVALAGMLVSFAGAQQADAGSQEQSLGDYARNVRKDKKTAPTKTFDNDNLPMQDNLSVVGNAPPTADSQTTPTGNDDAAGQGTPGQDNKDAAKAPEKLPTVEPGQSQQERQQVYDKWSQKLTQQKDKIGEINHDLDMLQREYKLRAAEMYGDAGSRLRNETAWDKTDADYKQKIDEKQKELDQAKQGMDDMEEDARKAGVPSSEREQ